jgi:hypothetical protein
MRGAPRVDLLKLDIEGMELAALAGATLTIATHHPVIVAEYIKCGEAPLRDWLVGGGYVTHRVGMNILAFHESDPARGDVVIMGDETKK